jgi:hypothetical protein
VLIVGLDGVPGKEKKDNVYNPGCFRRASAGGEDELISAEFLRHVTEIMRVTTSSSNLKGTFIKTAKNAASFITAAWMYEMKKSGTTHNSGAAAMRIVVARLSALEEENAALRRELAGRTVSAHEYPRCSGSASESGRPLRKGKSDGERINAVERKFE